MARAQPAFRSCWKPAKPGTLCAMLQARAALDGSVPGLSSEEALAERERYYVEEEARKHRQGQLRLVLRDPE